MKRGGGVLMHIASLPGPFGIGVFGEEAVNFSKQLKEQGMKYWQVLPFSYPGMGDSPYQSFSAFAGNMLFIDPRRLMKMGLLTAEEVVNEEYNVNKWRIDYDYLRVQREKMLRLAFSRADEKIRGEVKKFLKENKWADDVACFQAAKDKFYQQAWWQWTDEALRDYDSKAVAELRKEEDYLYHGFVQYIFTTEWALIKKEINDNGIQIIGDMPIYVSCDSADVWSAREMFKMADPVKKKKQAEKEGEEYPETAYVFDKVAGVPPDYFCEDGQLWGNPIYDWKKLKATGYEWWMRRLEENFKLYDIVRIDHFRAFSSYWEIPSESKTARVGEWVKGPGMDFFHVLNKRFGDSSRLIAEDLGEKTPDLEEFLKECGLPCMKVMQFAFNPGEDSSYLPHNYEANCVAYTGTHDNNTLLGWLWEANEHERRECLKYCGFEGDNWGDGGTHSGSCRAIIRTLWMSHSNCTIIPIQDMLGYGGDTRMNIPGTPTGNWVVRFSKEDLDGIDNEWYRELNRLYRR
ncbi:MAG: 4-alpha-glucanotransferase [Clostridiales bacterium]|nr:4-alpha-glucanotransferase [Clostridiales bacterium]